MAKLDDLALESANDFFYCDPDEEGNREIWEPFENWEQCGIDEAVDNLKHSFIEFNNLSKRVAMSQDDLKDLVHKQIAAWVQEEMELNSDAPEHLQVSREQRVEETIISFMEELQEYLPYRNYDIKEE